MSKNYVKMNEKENKNVKIEIQFQTLLMHNPCILGGGGGRKNIKKTQSIGVKENMTKKVVTRVDVNK